MRIAARARETGILTAAVALALLAASAAEEAPIRTEVEESARARLLAVNVRIEPTRWANLGECRELTAADLSVSLKRRKISPEMVELDRKRPPTLHALAVDTSGSMAGDLPYAQYAASEYVKQLRPGYEKAFVITFDESVNLLQRVTGDKKLLLLAIDEVRLGARTAMYDAMYYAMRELDAHRERPVLVLLTDGADLASFYDDKDAMRLVANRPDLTVFTIGVGLHKGDDVKPTRQSLRQLAETTDGEFFDVAEGASLAKVFGRIRDILENEAVLTIVDPDPRRKEAARINVRSKNVNCKVRMLRRATSGTEEDRTRQPIPQPFPEPPQSYSMNLTWGHQKLYDSARDRQVDRSCGSGGYFYRLYGGEPLDPLWFFHVGQRGISGCGLDVTMEYGLLYSPADEGLAAHNPRVKIRARPFDFSLPPMEQLPGRPEEVMNDLARVALSVAAEEVETDPSKQPADQHARPFYDYPNLAHGMTFMEMRPVLARAAFLYPRYRDWALAKLDLEARAELDVLKESYRRRFPDYPEAMLETAALHSEDAQRIKFRASHPSEIDLQKHLAAWLGDIPAHELFLRWERDEINESLGASSAGLDATRFIEAWRELRRVFFVPSYARSLTLLAPVYDRRCDCVGFWRVALPRSSWMGPRLREDEIYRDFARGHLDLIADRPFGLWVASELGRKNPELWSHLREHDYRTTQLDYELLGEPDTLLPATAFNNTRVRIRFESAPAQLEVAANLILPPSGEVQFERIGLEVVNDPDLMALAAQAQASLTPLPPTERQVDDPAADGPAGP
jgi:VWFA-related protein